MSNEQLTDFDVALAKLRAAMMMNYGGVLLLADTDKEKSDAFVALISTGIEIISSAISSRKSYEEVLQVTIKEFPEMLTESVIAKVELMKSIEAEIEREGATVQ
jgi:DeoR/GlpR family transcriptional regulator of sugar metabolism